MLSELVRGATSVVQSGLVCFCEEARTRGFRFVVDEFEDCADILGGVFGWVTGIATCVNVVEDLLGQLSLKLGLRALTGVEVLAWTREG